MNRNPLVIWILGDGKPGHENQSLGLVEAIARRKAAEIHHIPVAGCCCPISRSWAAAQKSKKLPQPAWIIAAGHATHLPLLWLARQHRAKSMVLMRPSLPLSWFDLCIAPEHDFPAGCSRPNVVLTRGALNRVTPAEGERSGKLILLGGPSKSHGWDGAALLEMLAQITDRGGWELTDSRRTPRGFFSQIRETLPGITAMSHEQTPPGWVPGKLAQAKEVWVTEDSVSMIYEALTSGARVGLLPMPRRKTEHRVLAGIDRLVADGYLTPFEKWRESGRFVDAPERLREAERCADLVLKR